MQTQILLSESYEQNKTKYEKGNHIVGISMWEFDILTEIFGAGENLQLLLALCR